METAPVHPAYRSAQQHTGGSWCRRLRSRTGILLISAVIVSIIGWVSGVFEAMVSAPAHTTSIAATQQPTASVTMPAAAPATPNGTDASLSPVPVPLVLTGTQPGRNPREGQAVIGIEQNSPQTYSAGAILANNARIAEIYTDHVVLERDGQRVNLYLQGTGKHTDATLHASLLTVGGTPPPPLAQVTSHEILTDYLRPSPVYDGQQLKGYQVYPGQQSTVFAQMGLQSGDVITAINGAPLNEPQSAIELLKQLTQGYAFTATVERQGKTQSIALDGALITRDQQRMQSSVNKVSVIEPSIN
jgi:type II secretion system protein C